MSYELTGRLIAKFETFQRSETFKTREFVIEKSDTISVRVINNYIKFQAVQERTTMLDRFNIGDEVKVHFNIKGSKWEKEGKTNYITNLDAWRIEQIFQPAQQGKTDAEYIEPLNTFSSSPDAAVDDLPF